MREVIGRLNVQLLLTGGSNVQQNGAESSGVRPKAPKGVKSDWSNEETDLWPSFRPFRKLIFLLEEIDAWSGLLPFGFCEYW
jgi:hypothetical protein